MPCYDPITGELTGACSLGGDVGPTEKPTLFTDCCEGGGRCVPETLVDTDLQSRLSTDTCAPSSKTLCAPDLWVENKHAYPAQCHGLGGAEGRCLSKCLPEVSSKAERLQQDVCKPSELCAPCFDPVTGADTKACSTGDDPGPHEPARRFSTCCGSVGSCVPNSALLESERTRLNSVGCEAEAETMCVPSAWVSHPETPPPSCRAYGELEGRCLPSCLTEVQGRIDSLRQNGCADEFLCVPCFDPLSAESTGACNVGADPGPAEPAATFSACGDGLGRCVPAEAVQADDRDQLNTNSCGADAKLCAPEAWLTSPITVPAMCTAPGDLEGRCLPDFLPGVQSRKDQLVTAGCAAAHSCVPCYDPVTGASTRACEVGDDKPAQEPKLFPTCCGGGGMCVPGELVSSDASGRLGADSCGDASGALCVPQAWVGAEQLTAPKSCRAFSNAEGRCLSACLPEIGNRRDQLRQDVCGATELCAPCFDPVDGHDTGACGIGGDAPKEPPHLFDACCGTRGRCVPPELVSSEDSGQLSADSCSAAGNLCVPGNWISSPPVAPTTCRGYVNAEGRCLPSCLPEVAAQSGKLLTTGCEAQTACVPCYDPVDGTATGACSSPGDTGPKETARTFPKCGSGIGRCVPNGLVDTADRAKLNAERCAVPLSNTCVPAAWLDSGFTTPPVCRAPGNLEGRCLADFLPDVSSRAGDLRQTTCAQHELCVPCYDPLTGASTNACTIRGDVAQESPKTYSPCCSGGGTCVPGALITGGTGTLSTEGCAERETFCVPSAAAQHQDPGFAGCSDPQDFKPGACVPSCFINPWLRLVLDQDNCLSGNTMCVGCSGLTLRTAVCP